MLPLLMLSRACRSLSSSSLDSISSSGLQALCVARSLWPACPHAPARAQLFSTRGSSYRFTDDYDKHHRVNDAIFARALQVVHPDGHTSVLSRRDALKAAAEQGLDLVEFKSPHADTPTCKIVDYKALKAMRAEAHRQAVEQGKAAAATAAHTHTGGTAQRAEAHAAAQASGQGSHEQRKEGSTAAARGQAAGEVASSSGRQQQGRQQVGVGGSSGQKGGKSSQKKEKAKALIFSPKIARHDIDVRLRKARQWLLEGKAVSLSRELDSTDSSSAADLAVDAMVAQLADVGAPLQKKHRTAALITVVLQPSADGGRSQTLG